MSRCLSLFAYNEVTIHSRFYHDIRGSLLTTDIMMKAANKQPAPHDWDSRVAAVEPCKDYPRELAHSGNPMQGESQECKGQVAVNSAVNSLIFC